MHWACAGRSGLPCTIRQHRRLKAVSVLPCLLLDVQFHHEICTGPALRCSRTPHDQGHTGSQVPSAHLRNGLMHAHVPLAIAAPDGPLCQAAAGSTPEAPCDSHDVWQVLDTCAAPGSKTAQMLEMLHDKVAEPSGALTACSI